jgi:hypothetical protein
MVAKFELIIISIQNTSKLTDRIIAKIKGRHSFGLLNHHTFPFYFRPLPVEAILDKARSSIDREGYNLIYSNCEHFTTDCRYGQSTSRQVGK